MPTLSQTQTLLWKLITAPEGAASGLSALPASQQAACASLVRGDERLSAIERIDVYADMYFYRIRDALREDFGAVHAVLGAAHFHNLVTDYLLAHPPSHFSLRYIGQHLPAFLAQRSLAEWPYLSDLALLEWSILNAFDAPDVPVLDATVLQVVPIERWPELRFRLTPSLQQLDVEWAVQETWQENQCGAPIAVPRHEKTALRVWRRDLQVFHRRMSADERAALTALAGEAPFADVCAQIIACDDTTHDGAGRAFQLLGEWVNDGLIAGFTVDEGFDRDSD